MMRSLFILLAIVAASLTVKAETHRTLDNPGTGRNPYYQGYTYRIEDGDTILVLMLSEITCFNEWHFRNRREEQFYWRTVRNVRIMLPYAKMIKETLVETYEYIETFPTQKEREDYLKQMEKELFNQYKPILRKFSRNQAKLLIKLIQRETDQTSYDIVRAFLGSTRALFWQGFGRFFGVNLKGRFEPEKNREDMIINRIATRLEEGTL